MTGDATKLPWHVALGVRIVGQENVDRLIEELDEAIASDFHRWQENDSRLARERPQIKETLSKSKDVASFIFNHLLPLMMDRSRRDLPRGKHKILDLVAALEPDQFVALVIVYADRVGDRDGVSRAFDIFTTSSSVHRQQLEAYRNSSKGGHQKAFRSKAERVARDLRIREQAVKLRESGKPEHNLASILSKRFKLTPRTIRTILKNTKP